MISDDDALRLTARRSALMADAAAVVPGGMLAVLDLDPEVVAALVAELGPEAGVVVANDNSPRQQVASGTRAACDGWPSLSRGRAGNRGPWKSPARGIARRPP